MEQLPTWLEAAINAAGMATAYNANDWTRITGEAAANDEHDDTPPMPH